MKDPMSHSDSLTDSTTDASPYRANAEGFFGEFGGAVLPPHLAGPMADVATAYAEAQADPAFQEELAALLAKYVGRPSLLYAAENLTKHLGGARIYLKREDLNHTGAHKINHCLGEALLAKRMGKTHLIAETGAGQHGVALATAAALVGLKCEIHMGAIDVAKQHSNVLRMELLGANVVAVEEGGRSLKEAVDSAFGVYAAAPEDYFFAIGSVVGPHPFPDGEACKNALQSQVCVWGIPNSGVIALEDSAFVRAATPRLALKHCALCELQSQADS